MIKIENLNKYYSKGKKNEYHVINNISYEFNDTGLYVFFGPSGCGKTTLLNVIGCLDTFDSGKITYENQVFNKYVPKTADELRNEMIGYIFQNYNLVDSKNVYENIEIVLDMLNIKDKEERNKRITEVLKAVGLYKHRKRNVLALSGGERQRVAIARALAKNPRVILADEPTGNLDSNNTFEIMNIIKKISKDRLVILVSHEKNLVDYYADRIIELKDGKIVNDFENLNNGLLNHEDSRNIYLKDYSKKEINDTNINVNLYAKNKIENISLDVIYRDGEIYLKSTSSSKVHFIDEGSEIKLLDVSSNDFKKIREEEESGFSFETFGDSKNTGKKKYISIFNSIKSSFKSSSLIKRNIFTRIVLCVIAVSFAFIFTSLSAKLTINEKDFLLVPSGTVQVTLRQKEVNDGITLADVYNKAKNIDGFESCMDQPNSSYFSYGFVFDYGRFYQTSRYNKTRFDAYFIKDTSINYELLLGEKINSEKQVVLGKFVADSILESEYASINGYKTYEDLIGCSLSLILEYNENDDDKYEIVGISSDKSYSLYMHENSFVQQQYFEGDTLYITCKDKEKMIDELSESFLQVVDSTQSAKKTYIKKQLRNNQAAIIAFSIIAIALFIYMSLMIRSNMFGKIKEIGILRSIGATKKDIKSLYVGEIISLTLRTSFISYTIMYLIIVFFSNKYSLSSLGIKLVNANLLTYFVGIILIFLINILGTIIPISILVNKTPVEIIKKYDI